MLILLRRPSKSGRGPEKQVFNLLWPNSAQGDKVVVADLPTGAGADVAKEIGDNATFVATDVREWSLALVKGVALP
jgi:hypothetical protein